MIRAGFLILLILIPAAVFAGEEDPVLAEAGEYAIRQSDLDRQISFLTPEKQHFLRENPQQQITLLKRMMQVKIISGMAKNEGLDKQTEVRERLDLLIDDFLVREYLARVVARDVTITEEDRQQYYKLNSEKFTVPEQVRARHILVKISPGASPSEKKKAREKAEEILEKVKNGEDFAKLAEEYSGDPGSRMRGGDLGFFGRGRMVKPFEDKAFSMKPGETSDVVETGFGYHIIKVEEFRAAQARTYDEVKDVIEKQLKNELTTAKTTEFLKRTTEEANLKIHSDKIIGASKQQGEPGTQKKSVSPME